MKTHIQKEIENIKAAKLTKGRERKYIAQLKRRGFSNYNLWSLDAHLAQLIYPRLLEYLKGDDHWPRHCWPNKAGEDVWSMTEVEMMQARADVLFAFERIAKDDFFEWDRPKGVPVLDDKTSSKRYRATQRRVERGLRVFAKDFLSLWT
jgi:hypothetical protein